MESSDIETQPSTPEVSSKNSTTVRKEDVSKIDTQEKEVVSDSSKKDGDTKPADSQIDRKAFVRGHRRNFSSPPTITITYSSSCDNEGLVRSLSDSNVNETHAQKVMQKPLSIFTLCACYSTLRTVSQS